MLLEILDNSWLVYAPDQDSNCYHLMSSKEKTRCALDISTKIYRGYIRWSIASKNRCFPFLPYEHVSKAKPCVYLDRV